MNRNERLLIPFLFVYKHQVVSKQEYWEAIKADSIKGERIYVKYVLFDYVKCAILDFNSSQIMFDSKTIDKL